jgi:membrane AbrB-like protein
LGGAAALAWAAPGLGATDGTLFLDALTEYAVGFLFLLRGASLTVGPLAEFRGRPAMLLTLIAYVAFPTVLFVWAGGAAELVGAIPPILLPALFLLAAAPPSTASAVGVVASPLLVCLYFGLTGSHPAVEAVAAQAVIMSLMPFCIGLALRRFAAAIMDRNAAVLRWVEPVLVTAIALNSLSDMVTAGGDVGELLIGAALAVSCLLAVAIVLLAACGMAMGLGREGTLALVVSGSAKPVAASLPLAALLMGGSPLFACAALPLLLYGALHSALFRLVPRLARHAHGAGLTPSRGARVIATLLIGGLAGAIFHSCEIPLAWLLGPALAVMVAAVARLPVDVPQRMMWTMMVVLGVNLGSHFRPDSFARAGEWVVSLSALALQVVLSTALINAFLRRWGGYSPVTAFFAATPGGIVEMTHIGGQMGGDEKILALSHSCRLLLIVVLMPVFLWAFTGTTVATDVEPLSTAASPGIFDIAVWVATGLGGAVAGVWLRLPAAALVGPMIFSSAAYALGFSVAHVPFWLIAAAQVVVGCHIGNRFRGAQLGLLGRVMLASLGSTIIHLNFSLLFAFLVHLATGLPVVFLILAFSPGGVVETSLMALGVGADPTFVTSHAATRVALIVLGFPLFFRLSAGLAGRGVETKPEESR